MMIVEIYRNKTNLGVLQNAHEAWLQSKNFNDISDDWRSPTFIECLVTASSLIQNLAW